MPLESEPDSEAEHGATRAPGGRVAALRQALLALDGPLFAVFDGAQFENLPGALAESGLKHRCLYLDRGIGHPERLVTAPYLVWLEDGRPDAADPGHFDRALHLLGERPAATFWQCGEGGERLYRHLRGINRVLVPRAQGEAPRAEPDDGADGTETHEAALFRHADANVLAQVIPVLAPVQLARLLGPAEAIFFAPDADFAGLSGPSALKILRRQVEWPQPRPGLLRIEAHQYEAMRHVRLEHSRRRVMRYLRDCAPDDTKLLDDGALHQHVLVAEKSGRDLGLRSEAAQGQWAFLMLTTGGQIEKAPPVRRTIGEARDPDEAVTRLMREMVELSQADLAGAPAAARRP